MTQIGPFNRRSLSNNQRVRDKLLPSSPYRRIFGRLGTGDGAAVLAIVPFFLNEIGVVVPIDIRPITGGWAKGEVTLIANFLTARVCPGVEERVGSGLHLLVGGNVDGAIGIIIVGAGRGIAALHTANVGHSCVNGVGSKVAVIAAESRETALGAATDYLVLGSEDKENVRNVGCPAICILRIGHFVLNITVLNRRGGVSRCIDPGASENGIAGSSPCRVGVLGIVGVQARTAYVPKIAQDQTVVVRAYVGAGWFPKYRVDLSGASHHRASTIH